MVRQKINGNEKKMFSNSDISLYTKKLIIGFRSIPELLARKEHAAAEKDKDECSSR